MSDGYARLTARLVRAPKKMMMTYACADRATAALFWATPTGFIPRRTRAISSSSQAAAGLLGRAHRPGAEKGRRRVLPIKGVLGSVMLAGFDGPSQTLAPNSAAGFSRSNRSRSAASSASPTRTSWPNQARAPPTSPSALIVIIPPPLIQGIGSAGGYRMIVQDRGGHGYAATREGNEQSDRQGEPDRRPRERLHLLQPPPARLCRYRPAKAEHARRAAERVFEALQVYLGSAFVNDFNLLGRTYRVTAQADAPYRQHRRRHRQSADAVELGGDGADRFGRHLSRTHRAVSRDALQPLPCGRDRWRYRTRLVVGRFADDDGEARGRTAAAGYGTEWTDIAFQQKAAANTAGIVFALAVVFVFLVLAAQYESLMLPLAIILIVPMCLLAAMAGVNLRGMDNNVLTQIGLSC
jgi:multidrug efflux pump subunit AcrB